MIFGHLNACHILYVIFYVTLKMFLINTNIVFLMRRNKMKPYQTATLDLMIILLERGYEASLATLSHVWLQNVGIPQ